MQSHKQQNQKGKSEPAIRTSVLCAVLGGVAICILAISVSRYRKGEPVGIKMPSESVPRQDESSAPLNSVRTARIHSPPELTSTPVTASNYETQMSLATEIARGISNELRGAREKLTDLKDAKHYGDKHPGVQEQLARIESLEQSAAAPPQFFALVKARADLAKLRVGLGEPHPDVQEQLRVIESFERSAAVGERSELAEAKAELQRLRVRFSDAHPAVQSQLQKVTELQK